MPVDINRSSAGVYLPEEVSAQIWEDVQEQSVIQQVATEIDMPGPGVSVDIVTGDPVAEWVGETDQRTVSRGTASNKKIKPHTLSLIVPFSNEFKRDKSALFEAMAKRFPAALAKKIDQTVLFGTAPNASFDDLSGVNAHSVAPGASNAAYAGTLAALTEVVNAEGDVDSWILAPRGEVNYMGQLDADDRPFFTPDGGLLGRPVVKSRHAYAAGSPNTIGFGGDWSEAFWGAVDGIRYSESEEVTLQDGTVVLNTADASTTVEVPNYLNTWQQDMFAIKVQIEFGFRVKDVTRFVRLTD